MGWKESKRAQGFKDMLVWLEPAAVEALEQLKAASPGSSSADIISKAVILVAGMEPSVVAGPVAGGPDPEVASLKDQLAGIEARLARVEAFTLRVAAIPAEPEPTRDQVVPIEVEVEPGPSPEIDCQEPAPEVEPTEPKCRNGGGHVDATTLLEAVADKVEEVGGWDFNVTALYRELEAKGVKVQSHSRNFCTWVTKHHAAVEAILDQRRADRGEG